jgi:hypothetical protein
MVVKTARRCKALVPWQGLEEGPPVTGHASDPTSPSSQGRRGDQGRRSGFPSLELGELLAGGSEHTKKRQISPSCGLEIDPDLSCSSPPKSVTSGPNHMPMWRV